MENKKLTNKIKKTAMTAFVLFLSNFTYAQDNNALFAQANQAYSQKDYKSALSLYQSLAESGVKSAELSYNLANCFAKLGDKPRALLNYKRAQLLNSTDADIRHNYEYISNQITRSYIVPQKNLIKITLDFFTVGDNKNLALMLALIFNTAFFLLLGLKKFSGYKISRISIFLSAALFLLFMSLYITALKSEKYPALIVTESAQARYEPDEQATMYFEIFGGEEIYLLKNKVQDGWVKIERLDGKKGWIESSAAERI